MKVAVVIPFYTNSISTTEMLSLKQCNSILKDFPIVFVSPMHFEISAEYEKLYTNRVSFDDDYFKSVDGYNKLMLSIEFYKAFSNYDYILIHQLDAYVFSNKLSYFCELGYDYIGAPWSWGYFLKEKLTDPIFVGNGGFSLRNVKSFIKLLSTINTAECNYNEDLFFSSCASLTFKVAPIKIASSFSIETNARFFFKLNKNTLPFGCHAYEYYDFDFWKPYILETEDNTLPPPKKKHPMPMECNFYLLANCTQILHAVKHLLGKNANRIFIYGAGKRGACCANMFRGVDKISIRFVDRDKSKAGTAIGKFKIFQLTDIEFQPDSDFIVFSISTQRYGDALNTFIHLGFKYGHDIISLDAFKAVVNEFVFDELS